MEKGGIALDMRVGLFQQQTLKLAMTQELSQAIALLQYSTQELTSFLESKAEENPLVTIETESFASIDRKTKAKKKTRESDAKYWIEQIGEEKLCLEEYLFSQIHPNYLNYHETLLFHQIVRNIDENGYLRASVQEIARACKQTEEKTQEIIQLIQSLEPAGVGARNLQECLLLQLQRVTTYPRGSLQIVKDCFIPFAEKKWKGISREYRFSMKELQEIFDFVQTLNPRPGDIFAQEKPNYIVPDVIVECTDEQLMVRLIDDHVPKIQFNNEYYNEMKQLKNKKVNQFLQDKYQETQWIMKGIQQRKETILKVMTKIAEKQYECVRKGFSHLKPMTMKEIADELEIHESTVSRTVKAKFVQLPFGTVEMREFFSSSLHTVNSVDVSAKEAKSIIQLMVQGEDKKKPFSDREIEERLEKEFQILLSRRTVAKYREQLNIPSSSTRKRF